MKVQHYIRYTGLATINSLIRIGIFFTFCFLISAGAVAQDNQLNFVSSAERSDGKGYVLRYHLDQKIDSFRVYQPTTDLIQMTLYGENVDTTGVRVGESDKFFDDISFYDIPFGVGVDIYLPDDLFFKAKSYHDANGKDLLLALTNAEKEEISYLTEGLDPVIWSRLSDRDNMVVGTNRNIGNYSTREYTDNTYDRVKNKMKFDVVVLDPGHGGHDPGAIGYKGIQEKDVVLNIAKKVGEYINEYLPEVKVVYTRDDDTFIDLEERGPLANKAEGDLFVSIHANKFHNRQPHGTETYFLGLERSQSALDVMKRENSVINGDEPFDPDKVLSPEELLVYELQNSGYIATSEKLAGMIEDQFANRAQRRSRGVKQGRLVVLYQASMPAILVEAGFLSNPSEQRFLSSDYGQSIIASAIFRAIRNYKEEYEKSQHFNTN